MLASESLSLIESEEATTTLIKNSQKKGRVSETPSSITSPKGLNSVILEDNKFEESVEFEDAHSHYSEESHQLPHRKCLPYLRNPNQKYNI